MLLGWFLYSVFGHTVLSMNIAYLFFLPHQILLSLEGPPPTAPSLWNLSGFTHWGNTGFFFPMSACLCLFCSTYDIYNTEYKDLVHVCLCLPWVLELSVSLSYIDKRCLMSTWPMWNKQVESTSYNFSEFICDICISPKDLLKSPWRLSFCTEDQNFLWGLLQTQEPPNRMLFPPCEQAPLPWTREEGNQTFCRHSVMGSARSCPPSILRVSRERKEGTLIAQR
jgi:hypothetical protein